MYSEKNKMHELTDEQIKKIIENYGKATELCIKAGFDGVEIHGGYTNLLQQFFSRHYNKRTDDWGGSDEKRMDFCLKIVDTVCKVRDKNNRPDFIIGYRLSPEEAFDDGITMTETMKLTRELIKRPLQYLKKKKKKFLPENKKGRRCWNRKNKSYS